MFLTFLFLKPSVAKKKKKEPKTDLLCSLSLWLSIAFETSLNSPATDRCPRLTAHSVLFYFCAFVHEPALAWITPSGLPAMAGNLFHIRLPQREQTACLLCDPMELSGYSFTVAFYWPASFIGLWVSTPPGTSVNHWSNPQNQGPCLK